MADAPVPPIEFLDWPAPAPAPPVELYRIAPAHREDELRRRLPEARGGSWATARSMLAWVSRHWTHGNDHVEPDALAILNAVAAGGHYACDEYATLLAQGLNALGIPAREVGLFQQDHYYGHSRAHSAAEAWIDDLDQWVLLDAQNGAFWSTHDGRPLSTVDLQGIFNHGGQRAEMVCLAEPVTDEDVEFWWSYFAMIKTTGASWSKKPFSPVFQDRFILQTCRLLPELRHAYPRLSDCWISVRGSRDEPKLVIGTAHPYALGYTITCGDQTTELQGDDPVWPLCLEPGEHTASITLHTPVSNISAGSVVYRIAAQPRAYRTTRRP